MNAQAQPLPVDYDPFAAGPLLQMAPTTEPQREIWLGDRLGLEASLSFNLSESLRLRGLLDLAALRDALQALVQRHDALRASFSPDGEAMCILEQVDLALPVSDLRALDAKAREASLAEHRQRELDTAFDLEQGGLFRCHLLLLGEQDSVLLMTAHHIVCDGWSWSVLVRDLGRLYALALGQSAEPLPPAPSFCDYADGQANADGSGDREAARAYWLSRFPGTPPVLDLPVDRLRPPRRSFASARVDHEIDAGCVTRLRALSAQHGAGLFAGLLACQALLLSRLAGEDSVVIGIPAAGQAAAGQPELVGHCVNLLPLRIDLDPDASFADLLEASQCWLTEAIEHQHCTLGSLLKHLPIDRDPSRMPLVAAVLNLEQSPSTADCFAGIEARLSSNPRQHDAFDLFLNIARLAHGGLRLECQYNSDCFHAGTVQRWLQAFHGLLQAALADPSAPQARLSLADERARADVSALQPADTHFDRTERMHQGFERQCDRDPGRTAIEFAGACLSYGQLEQRANAIAQALRGRGIGVGHRVGLAVDRGPDLVAALLGVLKSGAAYVPLDPGFPIERLQFMMADARLSTLLTQMKHATRLALPQLDTLVLDDPACAVNSVPTQRLAPCDADADAESAAYVIYTSGSTGRPKGVCVPHRAVANFLAAMRSETGIGQDDRLLAVTTLSFDIAVLELLLPLSVGATVRLASREQAGDAAALRLLLDDDVSLMQATPATWRLLLDAGWQPRADLHLLCGGETLDADLASALLAGGGKLLNVYGPTETTVWSTCARLRRGEPVHIGRPIANTQVWILDAGGQLLPVGVPGEICIGGEGVTLGYLDRPELSAERFIADPFTDRPGARLYRTGDRGRWREDGVLEHLGRLDGQVKLRGYRIELGEIEAQASALAGVRRAVALVRELRPGDTRLLLYLEAAPGLTSEAVLVHLRGQLPDYMLPQAVTLLERLPQLPNGKLDRSALPTPQLLSHDDSEPPRTALECDIAGQMAQVLGAERVGRNDDFFRLGGHSLLAGQLIARLNRQLGTQLAWRALFDTPTVAGLARQIGDIAAPGDDAAPSRLPHCPDPEWAPLTVPQERLRQLQELSPERANFNLPTAHRLQGPLDRAVLDRALQALALRHAVLRTVITRREGVPVQRILTRAPQFLGATVDLSALPPDERDTELELRMADLTGRSFDLAEAPPFRAALYRLDPELHVLCFVAHHVLWDGWSFQLMADELAELCSAFEQGRAPELPELPAGFPDYATWQQDWLQGPDYARQRRYWREQTLVRRDAPPLPHDRRGRIADGRARAGILRFRLDSRLVDELKRACARHDATLFMGLLGLLALVLHHRVGDGDVVVGTPVRGRHHADLEHLLGFFTSLLPLRTCPRAELSFGQFLGQLRSTVLEGFEHPDVLLEDVMPASSGRRRGAAQLYHAVLSYQNTRGRDANWGSLRRERIGLHPIHTAEDLGLWFVEDEQELQGEFIYNAERFEPATIQRLHRQFVAAARLVAAGSNPSLGELLDRLEKNPEAASPQARLAIPVAPALETLSSDAAPQTEAERLLAGLFGELFGIDDVARTDNFFELGGDSLMALTLIQRIEAATGVRVNLLRLASGTIGSLARDLPARLPEAVQDKSTFWRGLLRRTSA